MAFFQVAFWGPLNNLVDDDMIKMKKKKVFSFISFTFSFLLSCVLEKTRKIYDIFILFRK